MSTPTEKFFKTISFRQALKIGPKRFVKEYLFPAMRREHGRGFAMSVWQKRTSSALGNFGEFDGLALASRGVPVCNSVMCIGGTMQMITGGEERELPRLLGLPWRDNAGRARDGHHLFYEWRRNRGPWKGLQEEWSDAKTPAAKEAVAERAVLAAIRIGKRLKRAKVSK